MGLDDEVGIVVSDLETQFMPQSDDEDELWEVIEITGERSKEYKVKWAGINEKTSKPWPQSWVPKHDCTDDLVLTWKAKKKELERRKSAKRHPVASRKSRTSAVSRAPASTASSSTTTRTRARSNAAVISPDLSRSESASKAKRKRSPVTSSDELPVIVVLSDNDTPPPPQRKKRKVGIKIARPEEEMSSFEAALATKLRKAPSDSDEEDRRATRRTDKGKGKAKALEKHASEKGPRTSKFGAGLPLATKTVTQSRSLHVSKRKPVPKKHARSRSSTEGSSSDEAPPPVPLLRKKSQAQERLGSPVSSPAAQSHLSIPNVHKRRGLQTKRKPSDHSSDDALPSPASHLRRRSQDSERLKSPILSPAAEPHSDPRNDIREDEPETLGHSTLVIPDKLPLFLPGTPDSDDPLTVASLIPPKSVLRYALDNSYRKGVVPETETESSTNNTQSQPEPGPSPIPLSTPKPASLTSRIKLKTPRSGGSAKSLRPIPVMSPSKFVPHLPTSSLVESVGAERDMDEMMSSIEQFSSPEKGGNSKVRAKRRGNTWKEGGRSDEEFESSVAARGQDMAAAQKEKATKEKVDAPLTAKRTLTEHLKMTGKGKEKEKAKASKEKEWVSFGRRPIRAPSFGRGIVVPSPVDEQTVQEMEDAYVDLSGGRVISPGTVDAKKAENAAQLLLRLEEEESTQDLMQERGSVDWNLPERQHPPAQVSDLVEDAVEDSSHVANPTQTAEETRLQDVVEETDAKTNRQPSPTRVTPGTKPKTSPHLRETSPGQELLPPTASTRQNTPEHRHSPDQASHASDEPRHLGAAMTLLNTKSEEIAKLDNLLVAEQAKSSALANEVHSLQAALALAQTEPRTRETGLEKQLTELRELMEREKTAWESERSALVASVDAAKASKASAETDRDFFRGQYGQASAFVTSVREENAELEERARLAEERATTGVNIVKATFQQRVKALEDDIRCWKRTTTFLIEKDKRTDDDVRRRAAEQPQLKARCEELEEVCEAANEQITALEGVISRAEDEKGQAEAEISRLTAELNEVKEKTIKSEEEQHGDEMVYRCQWRPEGGNEACGEVFLHVEELQNHLFAGGHL